jgi:hypothetical protein
MERWDTEKVSTASKRDLVNYRARLRTFKRRTEYRSDAYNAQGMINTVTAELTNRRST